MVNDKILIANEEDLARLPQPSSRGSLERKVKVGFVQVNNSFSGQNYLPYTAGFLESYAKRHLPNPNEFEFGLPVYKRIPVDRAVAQLEDSDIVGFSTYVWNFEISKEIAKRLKQKNPETLIIFGGSHVPEKNTDAFLREHPYVDIASTGEGEVAFTKMLGAFREKAWDGVPSINFRDKNGKIRQTMPAPRIEDLNTVPSPYLEGFFEPLMKANPNEEWIALWETNRGCPFSCTFCDWGTGAKSRMAGYDMDRLMGEIDWFSQKGIKFVYCCDSNFGMYREKDLAIAKKFAENKRKYGQPEALSVQNTKNSTDSSFGIQKVLADAQMNKGVTLAFQSLNPPTLEAIKRANIKPQVYHDLQKRFTAEGVPTYSDIIIGLPEETLDTFKEGVSNLVARGQHGRIQFNNLTILPNAEMADPDYQRKYGMEIVETKMINVHGSLAEWTDGVFEKEHLVASTNTMSREDWVRARQFSSLASFMHFDKLAQIPIMFAMKDYGVSFRDVIDHMGKEDERRAPTLHTVNKFFGDKARDIQNGGEEYCFSPEYLRIYWPADEFQFIQLATNGKMNQLYEEIEGSLDRLLTDKGYKGHRPLLKDAVKLNRALVKLPFQKDDDVVSLEHNVLEAYKARLVDEKQPIVVGKKDYLVNRSGEVWDSWDEWCKKVVWYGNKKGAYLYSAQPVV